MSLDLGSFMVQSFSELLYVACMALCVLLFFASIIVFLMGFFGKDKNLESARFRLGAKLFFAWLLLFVVGFGICVTLL